MKQFKDQMEYKEQSGPAEQSDIKQDNIFSNFRHGELWRHDRAAVTSDYFELFPYRLPPFLSQLLKILSPICSNRLYRVK